MKKQKKCYISNPVSMGCLMFLCPSCRGSVVMPPMFSLDYEDKHYQRRKNDLENRLYRTYDKMDEMEDLLVDAKAKKRSILAEKVSGENIYKW